MGKDAYLSELRFCANSLTEFNELSATDYFDIGCEYISKGYAEDVFIEWCKDGDFLACMVPLLTKASVWPGAENKLAINEEFRRQVIVFTSNNSDIEKDYDDILSEIINYREINGNEEDL
jgi:hypothetical protein